MLPATCPSTQPAEAQCPKPALRPLYSRPQDMLPLWDYSSKRDALPALVLSYGHDRSLWDTRNLLAMRLLLWTGRAMGKPLLKAAALIDALCLCIPTVRYLCSAVCILHYHLFSYAAVGNPAKAPTQSFALVVPGWAPWELPRLMDHGQYIRTQKRRALGGCHQAQDP